MAPVVTRVECNAHKEACVEVMRVIDDIRTEVLGYVIWMPWDRHYAIFSADGRSLKAGFGTLDAATEHARAMVWP